VLAITLGAPTWGVADAARKLSYDEPGLPF
jgi:hypothetical protein